MTVGVPEKLRTAAKELLPDSAVEWLRAGPLRRYYVQSLISREGRVHRAWRRTVTHRKPVLYHLDVHVTDHCNLNCRGCEHYSSVSEPVFADLEATMRDLSQMAQLFESIEQMYLLGGEPLLHPQVHEFVLRTRALFPATRLYLMTNGILVTRMADEVWQALRDTNTTLLCDSYPINIDHNAIDALGAKWDVTVEWMKPAQEFFKIPLDPTASCDPAKSFDRCRGLSNCAIIRDGRVFPCAHAAYADIPAKRFGIEGIEPVDADSVSIWDGADGDAIIDHLMTPIPWCAHCDFDAFHTYEWSRGKGTADEWVKCADMPSATDSGVTRTATDTSDETSAR